MVARNDITGDKIQTKGGSKKYEDNFEKIFSDKSKTNKSSECCAKPSTSIGETTKRLVESESDC